MANDIKINLSVEGASASASDVSRVSDSLEELQRAQQAAATRAIDFTTKIAGAASAVQGLAGQLGVRGGAAGLIGSIASTSASMAQLGAVAGPQGALVGGIVGALVPAITSTVRWLDELDESTRRQQLAFTNLTSTNEQLAQSYERILQTMRDVDSQQRRTQLLSMGLGSRDEQAANVAMRQRELDRLTSAEQGATDTLMSPSASLDAQASASRLREDLRPQIRAARSALQEAVAAQQQAAADFEAEAEDLLASLVADANPERRRTGSRDPFAEQQEAWDRYNEAIEAGLRQQNEAKLEALRIEDEYRAKIEERVQAELDGMLHIKSLEEQRLEEQIAGMERRKELQLEIDDKLRDNSERMRNEHQRQVEAYSEVTGVIVGGLTEALTAIVAGEKSAEEAFKGMLASFLQFIAEQATLKAIFEGAEAVASAARGDVPGVALHLAAAAGYIAVGVAAGAGSIALSAPPSAPAEPEPGRSSQGSGDGGSVTILFNSPVITAGTRAELGRELQQTIAAGGARYA